jgi:hypothetical protein
MNTLFGKKSRGKGEKNVYLRQNLQKPDANCRAVCYTYLQISPQAEQRRDNDGTASEDP